MAEQGQCAFLSYARTDSDFALRLAKELKSADATVWIDQMDIRFGTHWDTAVEKALGECGTVLVILSPASAASENVMDEVSYALDKKKLVIPVLFQECEVPFRLRRLEYVDLRTDFEGKIPQLLEMLGAAPRAAGGGVGASGATPVANVASPMVAAERAHPVPVEAERAPVARARSKWLPITGAVFVLLVLLGWGWKLAHSSAVSSLRPAPASGQPVSPELLEWARRFVKATEGPDPRDLRPFFADSVQPFFKQPHLDWDGVEKSRQDYYNLFPHTVHTLRGTPTEVTDSNGREILNLDLYYVDTRRDGRVFKGIRPLILNLTKVEGTWKVAGIREPLVE